MRLLFAFTIAASISVQAANLLFHAPLDGSPVAAVAGGDPAPIVASGLDWGDGPFPGTKALRMGNLAVSGEAQNPKLAYSAAGNLPRESGTVAFWTRREWDFSAAEQPWRALFATPMPNGREKGRVGSGALWFWWYGSKLRADQSDAKDRYSLFDGIPPGDGWMHLAFTWRPGRTEIFVNGVRRRYLRDSDSPIRDAIAEAAAGSAVPDRSAIDRFFLGSVDGDEPADSLFSDLRIYDAPLAEEEIRELFEAARRQSAAIGRGDSASTSRGGVAPPPRHSGRNPHLRAPLPCEAPGTIAPEALDLVAAVSSEELAEMAAQGNVAGAFRSIGAMRAGSLDGMPYVEAGPHKGDRFALRLRLPAGHPLFLIEIDVPDDALRTQDMIVQPCRGGGDYALQVGLLLGGEYPNSGRMLTQKCLYWARTNDVALVAMTARDGAPAAVSAIRAYAVRDAALPASDNAGFVAGAPSPAESRHAALYYEDPALNLQFGLPAYIASTQAGFAEELSRLAAVMRFTGFDTLFYPGAWYQGLIDAGGYNPRSHAPHWREILYDAFDAEGLTWVPTINLNNIPWEPGEVTVESLSDGSLDSTPIAIHADGKPNPGLWHNTPPNYNFFHPAVQAEIERIFDTLLAEGASHPSFGGICLHLTKHCCLWWGSDESGYNDYAIEAFCRDTGRNLPSGHPAFRATAETPWNPLRGRDYAEWLRSDPALRDAWLQWRCDQVTAFYSRLAAKLAAAHPGAMLYVNNFVPPDLNRDDFDDPDFTRNAARGAGLDVSALEAAIPNLVVMQTAIPADYRWGYADHYFKFDDPACREEAVAFIRDHDSFPGFWTLLGETSRPWANQHDRYWESAIGARGDTLSCDWLAEHTWRVSTLNPAGDNALAHFTRPLRFHDTLGLSKGGFLVGTYGMEERLAPFALAFRSLPPAVLPGLPCSTDLVKVRGGEYAGTNYLYAVNTGDKPAEVTLPAPYGKVTLAPNQLVVKTQPAAAPRQLVSEIPPGATTRIDHHAFPLDLSQYFASGKGVRASVRVSGENISDPDFPWNGVKFMFHFRDASSGTERWPGAALPTGTFTNHLAEIRLSPYGLDSVPADGRAELILGLEGCTGRAVFDLSTLRIEPEDWGFAPTNQDWIVHYPPARAAASAAPSPLRGTMLPGRATREEDIETLHSWGATLVRFQITRNWWKVDDNQDLAEYARWVDSRLDNLADVLEWCQARGMKVCIDLHALPGGKSGFRGRPYEMNMFRDERYLKAFIDTWRRIAARFRGHPAIYGYDLVNEPNQRAPAPFSYWEVQRLAAEAVREIDPDTPVIVESNLADRACAFRYLSPLAMDNVIYQCHMYQPTEYTHQGVNGSPVQDAGKPLSWPGTYRGQIWDKEFIRRELAPVLDFQRRHRCKIYVGEFSAAAWAPGAENYLRDCIELFEEYGWDWTYHAFREAPVWDVEKEALPDGSFAPSPDTPRRRVLLDGFSRPAL